MNEFEGTKTFCGTNGESPNLSAMQDLARKLQCAGFKQVTVHSVSKGVEVIE
jgi:hypothetical protein